MKFHTGGRAPSLSWLPLAAGLALATTAAWAQPDAMEQASQLPQATHNPHSPRYQHEYRHGAVPTHEAHQRMRAWAAQNHAATTATTATTGPNTLSYSGGNSGVGVTSGKPKVYLVVYGWQWGVSGTDSSGNMTLSNDPVGAVPYLQRMFKGLGTNNELWSGVMTQYCDGPGVAYGATSCPSNSAHIPYPTGGGVLAGVWYDNGVSSPSSATGQDLANEAIRAAAHFGNTTAASNRYAQYVILSPTGTHPDGFPSAGFCAWHDWTGDYGLNSPYGPMAFTNMPYVYDAGGNCGANWVSGPLDGFSIVEGHEYAETITDQFPSGGWTNHTGSSQNGEENADECSWISSGQGAMQTVWFATGGFPMQSTWSNDTNRCDISHAVVGGSSTSQLLGNTGFESGAASPWTLTANVLCSNSSCSGEVARSGTWYAWLNGWGSTHTDSAAQTVSIPAGKTSATLSFYLHIDTAETSTYPYDTLKVQVLNSAGSVLQTLATYSNANAASGYQLRSFNLNSYIGQTVTIRFVGSEDSSLQTSYVLDDITLTVQ